MSAYTAGDDYANMDIKNMLFSRFCLCQMNNELFANLSSKKIKFIKQYVS